MQYIAAQPSLSLLKKPSDTSISTHNSKPQAKWMTKSVDESINMIYNQVVWNRLTQHRMQISNRACMRQRAWVWTRAQAGLCMCMFRCVFGDWLLWVCVRNVGHWPVQGLWNRISHPHRTATHLRHCRESTEWVQIGQYWALPAAAAALQPALALVPGVLQRGRA